MSMLDKPTFDESWYRVAELRPRLHPSVQTYRQWYRGQLWYVVHDPANNQFFRLREASYHLLGLLDGRRTVAEAWRLANDHLGDDAPTQTETIQLLGQLYTSNLLHGGMPVDAAGMFERYRTRVRREVGGYLMNVLFLRIPVWDPDRVLERWLPVVSWMFGPIGIVLWVLLLATGLFHLMGHWGELFRAADPQSMLALENLIVLYLCFAGIKAVHELGHGFACKRFGRRNRTGGEVHTIGIMLLVLMPVPYVDASSSWTFRSKWHRAFVGAAGMYVEIAVAAIAAIVWARTGEGTLVHSVAYNLIFIASISTVLFNGNPLLRYDGYYILSDLLELPNLSQRSKQYIYHLIKKYAWGVERSRSPAHSPGERPWLVSYGITASLYRVFIFTAILLYVADMLFFIGIVLAVGGLISFAFVPLGKFVKFLATSSELNRVRGRAVGVTVGVIALTVICIGAVPWPDHHRSEGVVAVPEMREIHADESGFVGRTLASGARVTASGSPLIEASDPDLSFELQRLEARRRRTLAMQRDAEASDPAEAQIAADRLAVIDRQIERTRERIDGLNLRSPVDGVWIAPEADRLEHSFVRRGQFLGTILPRNDLIIRVATDQYLGPRLVEESATVQMRAYDRPDQNLEGEIVRILPGGRRDLPSRALSIPAGGRLPIDPSSETGETREPFFQVDIRPDPDAAPLLVGQRVVARFELPPKPLAVQWWRAIQQLLQRRFEI